MRKTLVLWTVALALFAWIGSGPREGEAAAGGQKESAAQEEALAGQGFVDGTYTVTYDRPDERGWRAEMEIVVENGRIVSADFEEVNEAGEMKSVQEDYARQMEAQSGTTPADAYRQLETSLLEQQGVEGIDAVSGASGTSAQFQELAAALVEAARRGDTSPRVLPAGN